MTKKRKKKKRQHNNNKKNNMPATAVTTTSTRTLLPSMDRPPFPFTASMLTLDATNTSDKYNIRSTSINGSMPPPVNRGGNNSSGSQKNRIRTKRVPPKQLQQQQIFRQKVTTANQTAICTTTSSQVGRRTLRQLLLPPPMGVITYSVPIFQRRYCWTIPQWETLWNDFTKRSTAIHHSLGRLTCTNNNNDKNNIVSSPDNTTRSIIIDGQQRLTTVTLILAAIRDAILSLNENDNSNHDTTTNDPLLDMIHRMLFLDVPAMTTWISIEQQLEEGLVVDFCRLIPTYCDRNSYFAAILPPTSLLVQKFVKETYNPNWHRPLLAKQYFAHKITAILVSKQPYHSSPRQVLEHLTYSLIDGVDMLYFPIDVSRGYNDGTEDTQIIYERLAVRDATWCKPHRSTEYCTMDGCDMIRNLLLGSFVTIESKTNFYKSYWLPFERMTMTTIMTTMTSTKNNESYAATKERNKNSSGMEMIMNEFLVHEKLQLDEDQQKQLIISSHSFTTPSTKIGVGGRIYKDFESWMVFDYQLWCDDDVQQHLSTTSSSVLSSEEEHTKDVGRRLLEFSQRRHN